MATDSKAAIAIVPRTEMMFVSGHWHRLSSSLSALKGYLHPGLHLLLDFG